MTEIAIIGGGAAGFFTAAHLAEDSNLKVTIYEASNKVLSKVLISGGGRCNVTNSLSDPGELAEQYPRGHDFLKPVFERFTSTDTVNWFESRGVKLKTEDDGRMFPVTDSSKTIYDILVDQTIERGVELKLRHRLLDLSKEDGKWKLHFSDHEEYANHVVLATGCTNKILDVLQKLGLETVGLNPSLFTFNAREHDLASLSGISVPEAKARIAQIADSERTGPLLITHWGYSGPAILKLSAWQSIRLAAMEYRFTLSINWVPQWNKDSLTSHFKNKVQSTPKEKVSAWNEHQLPKRLWSYLIEAAALMPYTNWSEIGKKGIARLVAQLVDFKVEIDGKSTFKSEFVTAGGLSLSDIDPSTFSVRSQPHLYAVGELLNIDAITGGFNFQAAWSGGYLAANSIRHSIENSF